MLSALTNLAQYTSSYDYNYSYSTDPATNAAAAGIGIALILGYLFFMFAAYIFFSICLMKIFKKAGRTDSWAAWVPIYNVYVLFEIAGRPGWWIFLGLIPFVGGLVLLVLSIIAYIDLAKSFGKSGGFAALLILLPIIGYPMLAFGDSTYHGPAGPEGNKTPPAAPVPPTAAPQA